MSGSKQASVSRLLTLSLAALVLCLGAAHAATTSAATQPSVAFIRSGNLCLMGVAGQGQKRLTTTGDCAEPSWSPDGKKLVYVRNGGYQKKSLWVYDLAAGQAARLLPKLDEYSCPRWSPDGKWLACFAYDPSVKFDTEYTPARLLKINLKTKVSSVLKMHIWSALGLAWSPDGTRLAYSWGTEGTAELAILRAADGRVLSASLYKVKQDTPEVSISSLNWLKSGVIAFCEEVTLQERRRLAVRQVTLGGQVLTLCERTDAGGDEGEPAWSLSVGASGTWLVCWQSRLWSLAQGELREIANKVGEPSCR